MAMTLKDFRQLEKLMQMTTSDNDAEALSALRMANNLLKRYDYTWSSAFQRLVKIDSGVPDVEDGVATIPRDQDHRPPRREMVADLQLKNRIDEAFAVLSDARLGPNTQNFIDSLYEQWEKRGFLTEKQQAALFKNADEFA